MDDLEHKNWVEISEYIEMLRDYEYEKIKTNVKQNLGVKTMLDLNLFLNRMGTRLRVVQNAPSSPIYITIRHAKNDENSDQEADKEQILEIYEVVKNYEIEFVTKSGETKVYDLANLSVMEGTWRKNSKTGNEFWSPLQLFGVVSDAELNYTVRVKKPIIQNEIV